MFESSQIDIEAFSDNDTQRVVVIGSGYVGLTLASCLALLGHDVECTDVSIDRVLRLSRGDVPIVERGLPELVRDMLDAGRLRFGLDNVAAVSDAEFVFLCLPTPEGADGHADLSFVEAVAREIRSHLRPGATVVNKSTVPVGTAQRVAAIIDRDDIDVVSNPEFLAEGTALRDCLQPDRIIVGARTNDVARRVAALYSGTAPRHLILTDVTSAELTKYASNAYLATRLTFVNSIAEMCEVVGADIRSVVEGMGADQRIGHSFLKPGPGWGGSCFPKDTQALLRSAQSLGCDLSLVETAIAMNAKHTRRSLDKVIAAAGGDVTGKVIAVWGLAFKAGTDDLRSSPALEVATALALRGATVRAYDPAVQEHVNPIELESSMEAACKGADVLLVSTEWPDFAAADLDQVGRLMSRRVIVDARNVLDEHKAIAAGFQYIGVGLGHLGSWSESVAA